MLYAHGQNSSTPRPVSTTDAAAKEQSSAATSNTASTSESAAARLEAARRRVTEILKLRYGLKKSFATREIQIVAIDPGTSAEGAFAAKDEEQLLLDTTPCEKDPKKKQWRLFTNPYTVSEKIKVKKCADITDGYANIKVTQN